MLQANETNIASDSQIDDYGTGREFEFPRHEAPRWIIRYGAAPLFAEAVSQYAPRLTPPSAGPKLIFRTHFLYSSHLTDSSAQPTVTVAPASNGT
jgi:hypothetical protein